MFKHTNHQSKQHQSANNTINPKHKTFKITTNTTTHQHQYKQTNLNHPKPKQTTKSDPTQTSQFNSKISSTPPRNQIKQAKKRSAKTTSTQTTTNNRNRQHTTHTQLNTHPKLIKQQNKQTQISQHTNKQQNHTKP